MFVFSLDGFMRPFEHVQPFVLCWLKESYIQWAHACKGTGHFSHLNGGCAVCN